MTGLLWIGLGILAVVILLAWLFSGRTGKAPGSDKTETLGNSWHYDPEGSKKTR